MEFIPLEKCNKKGEMKEGFKKKSKARINYKKENSNEKRNKISEPKIIEKKKVINKRKEKTNIKKAFGKAGRGKTIEEEEKESTEEKDETFEKEEKESEEEKNKGENDENYEEQKDEATVDSDNEEEDFKRKCKEMDEKKKNRLFLKLKKTILNEAQIKELHPDITSVIFPRKKKTRWCWAVFASEAKAKKAMKKLIKNKDILVNKPTPYETVCRKRKEKMKTVLRKKQARKKLQEMWM